MANPAVKQEIEGGGAAQQKVQQLQQQKVSTPQEQFALAQATQQAQREVGVSLLSYVFLFFIGYQIIRMGK